MYLVDDGSCKSIYRQSIRHTLRGFRRYPGFSFAVILMIGLGIGATTTIFSVVDHVLLRPLPYPETGELVTIGLQGSGMSIPDFMDVRESTDVFTSIGAQWDREQDLLGLGNPERVNVGQLTQDFLPIFGARSAVGRLFTVEDFTPDAPRSVVLSHSFWQRYGNSERSVVGRTIRLDGQTHMIVGVLSADFVEPEALIRDHIDVWVPSNPPQALREQRRNHMMRVVARLEDKSTTRAQEQLDALALSLAERYPESCRNRDGSPLHFSLTSLHDATTGDIGSTLLLLMGAVGLMLCIACANIANLFLARGTDRAREMALRSALGSSRSGQIKLLLTESAVLGCIGGGLGIALAVCGIKAFTMLAAENIPRLTSIAVDWRIVAFATVLSVITGILFGLLPAFRTVRSGVFATLQKGRATITRTRRGNVLRDALMITEIALALMLLVGAGLLFNSFLRLRQVDPGFDTDSLLTCGVQFGWGSTRYAEAESKARFTTDVLTEVRSIPGVIAAGGSLSLPFAENHFVFSPFTRNDQPDNSVDIWVRPVTHGYLETLGARVMAGRTFTEDEDRGIPDETGESTRVQGGVITVPALVNETLAHQLWGEESPLGTVLVCPWLRVQVIGVIEDLSHLWLDWQKESNIYVPFLQVGTLFDRLEVLVRYASESVAMADALKEAVWRVDPDLSVSPVRTMNERMSRSMRMPRFYSALFSFFALVAFLLAASGIYASMTYYVRQRNHELGIRLALGGRPQNVVGMILGRCAVLTGVGIGIGLGAALGLSHLLESFVFGITPTDFPTFVSVSLLLCTVALLASYLPARKASGLDPLRILKAE